jgi:uncharacterized protein (DUF2336 family)
MPELFGHDLEDEVAVTRWAFALPAEDRDRLLLASASMLAGEDLRARPRAMGLLDALLPALAADSDPDTRRELAHRLSAAPWAPEALLLDVAFDVQLQAQAVVARAPALSEAALLQLVARGEPDTQRALAARSDLPASVVDHLIGAAVCRPALRDPLARRRDLTEEQAAQLRALAGPDLAAELDGRFSGLATASRPATDTACTPADLDLVDKLERAGRLTPGYAIRALRRGRPGVFGEAVARLADLPSATVADALYDGPADLALACAAARIDRAAFPAILTDVRALRGLPRETQRFPPEARAAFTRPAPEAAQLLRTAARRRAARWAPPEAGSPA